jgi:hypothetical protein
MYAYIYKQIFKDMHTQIDARACMHACMYVYKHTCIRAFGPLVRTIAVPSAANSEEELLWYLKSFLGLGQFLGWWPWYVYFYYYNAYMIYTIINMEEKNMQIMIERQMLIRKKVHCLYKLSCTN